MLFSRGMGKSGRVLRAPNRLTHSRLTFSGAIDCSKVRRFGFLLSAALASQEFSELVVTQADYCGGQ
jgi:hypothetical protein